MPETVLVTGGGGFLGRYVVRQHLDQGHTVRILGRHRYPALEALGAECLVGDLADLTAVSTACAGVDLVQHVAAKAGVWGAPGEFERVNVVGTHNVITACREQKVRRLVFTSTPSVVATLDGSSHDGVDESFPYPAGYLAHYPRTKALAEKAVLGANDGDLKTCALRPHLIFGPGDPHLVPRVLARARAGKLRIVGEGDNKVDLTYVENAARAQLLAAKALKGSAPAAGKAYFVSNDEPVELWGWINALLQRHGIPPVTSRISFTTAYRFGAALETTWRWLGLSGEPPMTRFVATQLATSHWFDISAARRDLGYGQGEPLISMAEGERRLDESLRQSVVAPSA